MQWFSLNLKFFALDHLRVVFNVLIEFIFRPLFGDR